MVRQDKHGAELPQRASPRRVVDNRYQPPHNVRMSKKHVLALALAAVLGLASCAGDDPEDPEGAEASPSLTAAPSPTVTVTETVAPSPAETTTVSACPNQETVIADSSLRQPGRLTGDLEDDGVADEVFLAVDESAEQGCKAFIVVDSEGAVRSAPIELPDIPFELGFPRLISMPLINQAPGAEIVVGVAAGASTQFAAVYTVVDSAIVPVLREGTTALQESLLAFGGSVGHQEAFDCAPEIGPGVVVVSSAEPVGGGARFRYVRNFFVAQEPDVFVEEPSLRESGTVRFDRFDTLHEFPNAPFGSCPTGEVAG